MSWRRMCAAIAGRTNTIERTSEPKFGWKTKTAVSRVAVAVFALWIGFFFVNTLLLRRLAKSNSAAAAFCLAASLFRFAPFPSQATC